MSQWEYISFIAFHRYFVEKFPLTLKNKTDSIVNVQDSSGTSSGSSDRFQLNTLRRCSIQNFAMKKRLVRDQRKSSGEAEAAVFWPLLGGVIKHPISVGDWHWSLAWAFSRLS